MDELPSFSYGRRLRKGEIRILTVLPGAFDSQLCGYLRVVHLSGRPEYAALSYSWGDDTQSHNMHIDARRFGNSSFSGCLRRFLATTKLGITKSVYEALQYLRHSDRPLRIWIDQICIQQSDIPEKNVQVQQMGVVYQSAQRTFAWLGPPKPGFEDALRILLSWADHVADNDWFRAHYRFIKEILQRKWFHRLWVLQEVVLSRQCILFHGHNSCALADVEHLYNAVNTSLLTYNELKASGFYDAEGSAAAIDNISGIVWLVNRVRLSHTCSSLAIMNIGRRRRCTDPRDHVNGLLGIDQMFKGKRKGLLQVNYDQDVVETFMVATLKGLVESEERGMLHYLGLDPEAEDRLDLQDGWGWRAGLPSWVPDWTTHPVVNGFSPNLYATGGSHNLELLRSDFSANGRRLCLSGFALCSVAKTFQYDLDTDWKLDQWESIEKHAIATSPSAYDQHIKVEAFTRAVIADTMLEAAHIGGDTMKRWPAKDVWLESRPWSGKAQVLNGLLSSSPESSKGLPSASRDYHEVYWASCTRMLPGRKFIILDTGRFALGPSASRKGDEIVVVPGVRMPFVLRKVPESAKYRMVGPAYVHGIMDGELVDWVQVKDSRYVDDERVPVQPRIKDGYELQEFVIE